MLVVDSGIRVPPEIGPGSVTCFLRSWRSSSGVRYLGVRVLNSTEKAVACIPALGHGAVLDSVAPHRVYCDPNGEQTFTVPMTGHARIERAAVLVQGPGLECAFELPIESPRRDQGMPLGAVAVAVSVGVLGFFAWQSLQQRKPHESAGDVHPPHAEPSVEPSAEPVPEPETQPVPAQAEEPAPIEAVEPAPLVAVSPAPVVAEEPQPTETAAEASPADDDEQPEPQAAAGPLPPVDGAPPDGALVPHRGEAEPMESVAPAQPPVRMANAIVEHPRSSAAIVRDGGAVIASIELVERKLRTADFEIKVVNDSPEPLLCSAMAARGGHLSAIDPVSFRIEAEAASALLIQAPLRFLAPFQRVLVQMRSNTLSYSVEAAVPRSPLVVPVAVAFAVLLLCLALLTAFQSLRPRVVVFGVPGEVVAGSPVRVVYDVRGLGALSYDVAAGARHLASGTLASGAGQFTFQTLPTSEQYHVSLALRGSLGATDEVRDLRAVQRQVVQPPSASIQALEVDDAVVASGAPIVARYLANAQQGELRLLDTAQVPWVRVPYAPSGIATLLAPVVHRPTPFRLELEVRRGDSVARASVGLMVDPIAPKPAPAAKVPARAAAPGILGAAQLLSVETADVKSGGVVRIRFLQHPPQLHLVLEDAKGAPVAAKDVSPAEATVAFPVPAVATDQTFVIVASFQRGSGEQTVLEPVTVHAR